MNWTHLNRERPSDILQYYFLKNDISGNIMELPDFEKYTS